MPSTGPSAAPRLTVLIAAWEAAASIERALDSVLVERVIDLECVVVDDGSTDGTADIVRAVAARDPRVVLVALPENVGVSAARNAGLEHARGEWLTFLDADDRLLPGAITALMAPTADPSVRVVVGQRIWTDGVERWVTALYDIPDIRRPGRKSIATHPGLLYYASTTGRVIHRSLIEGLRFYGRVLGDQPWTIRAMLRAADGIEVIGDPVYEWMRPRSGGPSDTITAGLRASASRASDMVRVARRAYADVADEVDARVDVPVSRARVKGAYLDRLARSDVGPALAVALDHRDADLPELLIAIGELLADIPPELLERSDPTFRRIVAAPLRSWSSLSPASRTAYRAIARTTLDREHARGARPARHGWSFAPALVAVDRLGLQRGAPLAAIWLRTAAGVRSVVGRLLGRKPATRRDVTPVER